MTRSPLPQRQSLVAQTAAFLAERIAAGEWRDWLPGERTLCDLLQVSRNTLRAALARLAREGRVRAEHGAGHRILVAAPREAVRAATDVALLAPEPIERLRPNQNLWIDDLRALLSERGVKLRVFHGRAYYGAGAGPALRKLVTRHPHGCWVLLLASETMQRWFAAHRVPCVLAGSPYPGIDLPFRDLDHRAMCRHAAGVLLGLGHRRITLLAPRAKRAGDLASEAGFLEAVRQSRCTDVAAAILHHDESVASAAETARRLVRQRPRPTALVTVHPYFHLAVATRLQQLGVRVPADLAMISRDDDPFLAFLSPVPARYVAGPHPFARSLLRPVLELLAGGAVSARVGWIMPEFHRGETIGPPPAAGS